jgi:uncharacterized protein YcbK (DUF882 family)
MLPDQKTIDGLERVRVRCGFPFKITSGGRCPDYNAKVSDTGRTGPHTKGAVDVGVFGDKALMVVEAARQEGATGIGVKQHGPYPSRFIHMDWLSPSDGVPRPHIWSYP